MISAGVLARLFLKAAPNPEQYNLSKCLRQVPHVVAERGFHRWGFLRLSAGSCGKCSIFVQKWFLRSAKRKRIGCECVAASGAPNFFFKIVSKRAGDPKGSQKEAKGVKRETKRSQREVKVSQREPKGSQRATNMHPKIGLGARADFWSKKGEPRIYFWSPF